MKFELALIGFIIIGSLVAVVWAGQVNLGPLLPFIY